MYNIKFDQLSVQLLLVTLQLHLRLKPFTALGRFAHEGMLGHVGILLHLVHLRMSRLLVLLKLTRVHAAPPNVLVETYHALIPMLSCMTLPYVFLQMGGLGESLVAGECELLEVTRRRSPGAGVADAKVSRLAVSAHVTGRREALVTDRTFVRARHLVDGFDVVSEVRLPAK